MKARVATLILDIMVIGFVAALALILWAAANRKPATITVDQPQQITIPCFPWECPWKHGQQV